MALVGLSNDLSPQRLIRGYRAGRFPWPVEGWPVIPWFSPDPRAVLPVDGVHVSRSLRRTLRRSGWRTTVDVAFDEVVAGCADRPHTWITPAMKSGYAALHRAGHAHSLEVWSPDGRLLGGVYGVLTGAIFSGESMFSRSPDASKVGLVDLAARFAEGGGLLIDCQEPTEHLLSLGALLVRRRDYLALLRAVRDEPVLLAREEHPVERLAP